MNVSGADAVAELAVLRLATEMVESPAIVPPGLMEKLMLPVPLAFDHSEILADYRSYKDTGHRPRPWAKL